jgi:hypothetical protein
MEVFGTSAFYLPPGPTRTAVFATLVRMGLKEEAVARFGFATFDVFRPGIIAGNANTPLWVKWLGYLAPGNWGTIEQEDIGRSFANRLKEEPSNGLVFHNVDMRQQSMFLNNTHA